MLAFAAVHGEFYRVTVGALKGFVTMEERLNVIVAGGKVAEIACGIAVGIVVGDDSRLAGSERIDVSAEDQLRFDGEIDLHAWLFGRIGGQEDKETPVEGLGAALFGEGDLELWSCGSGVNGQSSEKC